LVEQYRHQLASNLDGMPDNAGGPDFGRALNMNAGGAEALGARE
jgi:hypothetical protein